MKKITKENKGITLSSLVVYITVMFVVLAIVIRVMLNFRQNISDVTDVTFEKEFEKFNTYMLEETNKERNGIAGTIKNGIEFSDGNTISFKDEDEDGEGEIYFNNIKICEAVNDCTFTAETNQELTKTTITVNITINEIQKEKIYVMKSVTTYIPKLPKEYQEVEYIESTGTQYIDTEYFASQKSRIYADFAYTSLDLQARVFGSRADSGENYLTYESYINGNGILAWACQDGTGNWKATGKTANTSRIQLDFNSYQSKITYTGGVSYTENITTTRSTKNKGSLCIFASNWNNVVNYGKLKLYSFFIENNEEKVRELVPCYQKSDGSIGLYDLVEGKFYENAGEGEFLKGRDVTGIEEELLITGVSRLPNEYQEVEYISTTANGAYIDTGIIPNNNFGFEIELKTLDTATDRVVLGVIEQQNTDTRCWIGYINNTMYYGWNKTLPTSENRPTVSNDTYDVIKVNYNNNRQFIVNGTVYGTEFPTLSSISKSFCLLGRNWGGTCAAREQTMKYAKFTSGDKLTHYFIPCYRKSDGEIGLYDLVGKSFYTNAGTGEFSKGEDVESIDSKIILQAENETEFNLKNNSRLPSTYKELEYIESTGTQWINTNYEVKGDLRFDGEIYTETQNIEMAVIGTIESSSQIEVGFSSSNNRFFTFSNNSAAGITATNPIYGIKLKFTSKFNSTDPYKELSMNIDGGSYASSNIANTSYVGTHLELFRIDTRFPFTGRTYYLKIYDNGNLVRSYIPCYRILDGVVGLYDTVNDQFYTNSGTGTFIKGPEV